MSRIPLTFIALALASACGSARADDWPFFRGPARDGRTAETKLPLEWSGDRNVKWKAKLPRPGNGSAIVTGDRVFVPSAEDAKGLRRSLLCYGATDGKPRWSRTVTLDAADPTHGTNPYAASTPATDGKHVVIWHGSGGLHAYDLDGNELWKTDLGRFRHIWGYAASPVIQGGRVYLNCGPGARQFVVAVNVADGKIVWQTDEPGGADDKSPETKNWLGSWSSPVIAKVDGQDQLIVFQSQRVKGYDLSTGKEIWSCGGAGVLAYTDVVLRKAADGTVDLGLALAGYGGAAIAFKPGGMGDTTATNQVWRVAQRNQQRIGSGVVIGDYLYTPHEPGILCIDVRTGKEAWSQKFPGQSFWSSIVATPERMYLTSKKGTTYVFAPDPAAFKLLATNELGGETVNATPAVANGRIYIRTWEHLYCIGE